VLDLKSGEAVGPDEGRATTIPVRIEDGHVFISPERATVAASVTA